MNSPVDDTIQPYRFQPRRTLEESESSGEDESPNEDTDEELERLSFESRMGNTEWCKCGNCCPMTTAKESFCCQEFAHVRGKLSDSGGPQAANGHCPSCSCEVEMEAHCIVDHPDFYAVCLTKAVLDTALVGFHDVAHQAIPYPPPNRSYRYACYRQFTWFVCGLLGRKVRRVVPACVVGKIREAFPEASGKYTVFLQAEESE
eukprot:scpid85745/ scgid3655/ 